VLGLYDLKSNDKPVGSSHLRIKKKPLYQLFYDGNESPALPNMLTKKPSDEGAWGSSAEDARFLSQLRRLLAKPMNGRQD